MRIKPATIRRIVLVAGIALAELGNAALTYMWAPGAYIKQGTEVYSYNEFYDNCGDIFIKIFLLILVRIKEDSRLLKNILNFYIELQLIDLFYCIFFNPYIYHLSKIQAVGLTLIVYVVQIIGYRIWKGLNEKEEYPIRYKK